MLFVLGRKLRSQLVHYDLSRKMTSMLDELRNPLFEVGVFLEKPPDVAAKNFELIRHAGVAVRDDNVFAIDALAFARHAPIPKCVSITLPNYHRPRTAAARTSRGWTIPTSGLVCFGGFGWWLSIVLVHKVFSGGDAITQRWTLSQRIFINLLRLFDKRNHSFSLLHG